MQENAPPRCLATRTRPALTAFQQNGYREISPIHTSTPPTADLCRIRHLPGKFEHAFRSCDGFPLPAGSFVMDRANTAHGSGAKASGESVVLELVGAGPVTSTGVDERGKPFSAKKPGP
jgi:hypothetical protein